tara:strand:+ start:1045 stop:1773 length:729 start_codon:yes stop_codon:yes gene_type:complete
MEDFSNLVNWEKVFDQSEKFKKQEPFNFGYVENFLEKEFYEKLYENYPKIDDSWLESFHINKYMFVKTWSDVDEKGIIGEGDDPSFNEDWNKLKRYVQSEEFIENFRKFSGVPVTKLKEFKLIAYKKGGFQMPHIHHEGGNTLIFTVFFAKNWEKGDPGATYMCTDVDDDESIIFEPYNLDNTMEVFQDGPKAAHGVRYITKDVVRQGLLFTLEQYSSETGWSAGDQSTTKKKRETTAIEIE